jgi:hypothetical protein
MTPYGPSSEPPDFLLGLDLGKSADPSALAVGERRRLPAPDNAGRLESYYAVRYLKRWPLQTPYPEIVRDVADLLRRPPLRPTAGPRPTLALDRTGVGAAVADMFSAAGVNAAVCPVVITGGQGANWASDGSAHVSKVALISCMLRVFHSGRLKVANLPERDLLDRELAAFRERVTANANLIYEGQSAHDDLVIAVGLLVWAGENRPPFEAPSSPPPQEPRLPPHVRLYGRENRGYALMQGRGRKLRGPWPFGR